MSNSRPKHYWLLLAIAVSLSALFLSFTTLIKVPYGRVALAALGAASLLISLTILQLKLFGEGDRRKSQARLKLTTKPAPGSLRNPKLRAIWKHQEETRQLMRIKQNQTFRETAIEEKKQLGLPSEEEILFIGEPTWLYLWPLLAVSIGFLTCCALISKHSHDYLSFACLAAGLLGLLGSTVIKTRQKYYVTNFRFLVRTRQFFSRAPKWDSLRYDQIEGYEERKRLFVSTVTISGAGKRIHMTGYKGAQLETLRGSERPL